MIITRRAETPDSYKIAAYDALCDHFQRQIESDGYYQWLDDSQIDNIPELVQATECLGFAVTEDGLYVVMAIRGWVDYQGFHVSLPLSNSENDGIDDGAVLDVGGAR